MTRYAFGDYLVDTETVEILGPSGPSEFEPQVFAVLEYLLCERGRLITKEELLDNVWGDRFVSESALTTRIKQARRAIGDDGRTQWAIKTVHGRGYRFLPETTVLSDAAPDDAVDTGPDSAAAVTVPTPDAGSIPVALRPEGRHRCYGREEELELASAVVNAPGDDPIRWIWILGEPGIGKTRIAAEVASRAHDAGHRILFGRNSEDLMVPFQPFIDVLRTALAETGADRLRDELDADLTTVARLIPELAPERNGAATSGPVVDDETQRYQLFEAIASWLTTVSTTQPILLVIDDAHWAAASTLQTLAHLQRRPTAARVTILVTARDTAPDENPRVADLIAAAQGADGTRVLRLGGLPADAARRLVGHDADLDAAMEQTAGNPLLLQAVNAEDGTVDIVSAVRRRVASLSEGVQTTLSYAATIGLEFDVRIAAAAADRDELDVLDDLERAAAARLLDDVDVDRFRFTHALVRSSLRDDLSSSRRARLHGRIADAIDEFSGDDPRSLPELAHHTAEAAVVDRSRRPRAIELLESAAAMSSEQLSFGEAALFLERARQLAGSDEHATQARLALLQGVAETRAGFNLAAPVSLTTAYDEAAAGDDAVTRIEAAIRHEDATWRTGSAANAGAVGRSSLRMIEDASTVLDDVERDVSDDEISRLRTRLEISRIRALAMEGRFDDALASLDAAHELARAIDDTELEATLLNIRLSHLRYSTDLEGSDVAVDRLCQLMDHIDDTDVLMHALLVIALYRLATGDFPAHRRAMERMLQTNATLHSGFWEEVTLNQQAMMALYGGDLAACERIAEQVFELSTSMPNEDRSGVYGLRMFVIRREQDALLALAPMIRQVIEHGDVESFWAPGLALLLAESGSTTEAQQLLDGFAERRFAVPRDGMWETVMVLLVNTAVILDDPAACASLQTVFTRVGGTNLITGAGQLCFGSADRYLGMLAFTAGDLDEAERRLGRALEVDDAGESALWSNESRLWLAKVRRAQGHGAEAAAMFEVVAEQAEAEGLPRLRRLALAELSRT